MRTRLASLAVLLGLATVLAASGCDNLRFNYLSDGFNTTDRVTEVHIGRSGSGDVTVRADDSVTGVDVRRKVRYQTDTAPSEESRVEGSRLVLDMDCGWNCTVSYEVRLPEGASVSGENGSGDVRLHGVGSVDVSVGSGDIEVVSATGAVKVDAGSGDLVVRDVSGDLTAETSSGDIEASGISGSTTRAKAGSGDIRLDVSGGTVSASTGSGNIEIKVPDGACQVSADADSGDVRIDVTENSAGTCQVDAHAGSGNVSVEAR